MNSAAQIPDSLLDHWPGLAGGVSEALGSGLINETYRVSSGNTQAVIQKLHPLFGAEIHADIDAVTRHLQATGITTPLLLPTDTGELYLRHEGSIWRALTWVEGLTHDRVTSPQMVQAAGELVAQFHAALEEFDYIYCSRRSNIHDTRLHLSALESALAVHAGHRLFDSVARYAEPLLKAAAEVTDFNQLVQRHAHGDLKISNLRFDANGSAVALLDLDTIGRMAWPLEMGDALRSWCNPALEEQSDGRLDLDYLEAALAGYTRIARGLIEIEEQDLLITGLAQVCLELTARFLTDALNESYFGWQPENYASRGDHNLARAAGMWSLYGSVNEQRSTAEKVVAALFSAAG